MPWQQEQKQNQKNKWKTIAIIFIVFFVLLLAGNIWAYTSLINDQNKMKICYYDICSEYPQATYKEKICSCYDYDLIGNLIVVKTEYMK